MIETRPNKKIFMHVKIVVGSDSSFFLIDNLITQLFNWSAGWPGVIFLFRRGGGKGFLSQHCGSDNDVSYDIPFIQPIPILKQINLTPVLQDYKKYVCFFFNQTMRPC